MESENSHASFMLDPEDSLSIEDIQRTLRSMKGAEADLSEVPSPALPSSSLVERSPTRIGLQNEELEYLRRKLLV